MNGANGADASRQKVVRFRQPHQLRGPFASFRHPPCISEGKGLRQGSVERWSVSWVRGTGVDDLTGYRTGLRFHPRPPQHTGLSAR
jgi:hypothetical protein